MPKKLTDMETGEVSTVGSAANGRKFAIAKKEETTMSKFIDETVIDVIKTPGQDEEAFAKSLGLEGDAQDAAIASFRIQKGLKDLVSDETLQAINKAAGYEMPEVEPEPAPVVVEKSISPEMLVEIKKREDLEAIVKSMRDEAEQKDLIAKSEKDFELVPGTAQEIGELIFKANRAGGTLGAELEGLLSKVNEAMGQSSVFKTFGHDGVDTGLGGGVSAEVELLNKRDEIMKSDAGLSKKEALVKAMAAYPELHKRSEAERRA